MSEIKTIAIGIAALLVNIWPAVAASHEIPPAFGPYIHLSAKDFAASKTFTSHEKIVGTYYFYWYDAPSKTHITNYRVGTDGLTDHPPTLEDFSWKSVSWHKKQLSDMEAAGIDLALMVFWGAPSEQNPKSDLHWSYEGLKPLVQAREELLRAGKNPPAIGLFYDTSTLENNAWREHVDLTTVRGKQWFYATVRDFFSCIPAKHWAMIDNKPIVLLYAAAFAKNHDQTFVDYTKENFAKDFGGRVPYLAPQNSWNVKGDNTCGWGGALGLIRTGIAELGPGYDDTAVYGRTPLIAKREGGKFYEDNWKKFLRAPSNFVMLETWSEFHEGTDICESKEYGRQYIDLTRKYADLFKQGWVPPRTTGKFTGAESVNITLGKQNHEQGLRLVENDDGQTTPGLARNREARKVVPSDDKAHFIYFRADDSFKWTNSMDAKLVVEYYDGKPGVFSVQFDGSDISAPNCGAYTHVEKSVELTGGKTWKTADFELRGARFCNSENKEADFRLQVKAPEFFVRSVALMRQ